MKQKRQMHLSETKRGKSVHVLARILKVLKKRQKSDCPEVFGYSRWTIKKIILGKLKLSSRAAMNISKRTNVSIEWLLAGNGNVPPVTMDDKPFTIDSYTQHQIKPSRYLTVTRPTAVGLFPFIVISAARLMDAATAADKSIEASWRLKQAINSLGADFPDYATRGHAFEMSLISQMTHPLKGRGFDWMKAIGTRLAETEKSRC